MNAVDLDQSVDFSDGASDSSDSSQEQDVPDPDTSADAEPRVFKICGLCKFRFHEGQAIIAIDRTNSTLPLTWDPKYYPENEMYEPGGEKAFHAGCFRITGDFIFARGFLESCTWNLVRLDFHISWVQPPPSVVAQRTRWLKSSLSLELRQAINNRLPIEVCDNVAAYCISEYATNLHLNTWQRRDPSDPNEDIALPVFNGQTVWAQYVEVEGRNYVKSLSTVRMNDDDTKVFTAKSDFYSSMYFTEDSLGVRSVVVCPDDDATRCIDEPGLLWVLVPREYYRSPFYIRMNFDGLKLRNLDVTQYEKELHFAQRARWSIFPTEFEFRHTDSPGDDLYDSGHRATVHAIDWNLPGVSGYAIGLHGGSDLSITPNRLRRLSQSLVDAYSNSSSIWLYFPVDTNERVSELWLRSGVFPYDDDTGNQAESLIVVTNNGRSLILGPDIRSRSPLSDHLFSYEALVDLPSTAPTRTFYCDHSPGGSWLGFEKLTTWKKRKIELLFGPPARPVPRFWYDQFLSTSAELENVQRITPCRGWGNHIKGAIPGLLFTYADGHQRSVGQIRLDHLEETVNVASDRFWLGISDGDNNPDSTEHEEPCSLKGHVTWLGICEPMSRSDTKYLEIPLKGKLEWRSTWITVSTKSLVRYVEESESQNEMDQVLAREAASGKAASKTVKTFSVRTGDMCITYDEE
ncbi:hypothetical protein FGADI_4202 [Fusarium gaditjirri]|uniref:Uncharacterized protein n=1 Tax=Fusarium gaditjirri TaxID=282569 RepID=A0A8H4X013_9HYPO|nr:hypothetical protein FGADI_4202 [Fusarium gaditjirri]